MIFNTCRSRRFSLEPGRGIDQHAGASRSIEAYTMPVPLSHRTAIITGAARGLGAAMAAGLAGAGARLSLTDIDIAELRRTRDAIYAESGNDAIMVFGADSARYSDANDVVVETCARYGATDIVINNAAIGLATIRPDFVTRPVRFWEIDPRAWARILAVNVNGPFFLEHAAVPGMIKKGWGRVINVTTTFQTMLTFEVYGPSKAAIEAHSHIAAGALGGTGVTVNVVTTGGPADTAQVTDDLGVPRHSLLSPAIMVPPVLWLCSEAANEVTGRRLSAAHWESALPPTEALVRASRPIAWPELMTRIVVAEGSALEAREPTRA
jgi:NAD(P)-dependent dehydrogenase (short-subunit alcohol dehydrogenase family)